MWATLYMLQCTSNTVSSVGTAASGRNAYLCCHANNVYLPTTSWPIWLQYGHVTNLPQNVISFAHSLPRLPSKLNVLIVSREQNQSYRDFRVRRAVEHEALEWLLENNKYYRANKVHLNKDVLQQLPVNGDIS